MEIPAKFPVPDQTSFSFRILTASFNNVCLPGTQVDDSSRYFCVLTLEVTPAFLDIASSLPPLHCSTVDSAAPDCGFHSAALNGIVGY